MKLIFSVKVIPVLAAALLAPLVILAQTSGEQKTLTGIVSDAMCGSTRRDKDQGITDDLPGEFERFEHRKKELFQCFHAPR